MKRAVRFAPGVKETLLTTPLTLRMSIVDVLLDLADDPTPPTAMPYADIPGAYEIVTPTFRVLYTYGPALEHVSVWVLPCSVA